MPELAITESPRVRLIDQPWFVRLMEVFPAALSWATLILPIVCSILAPLSVAYFIIAFDLYWMFKSLHTSYLMLLGYGQMKASERTDWGERLDWIRRPQYYRTRALEELSQQSRFQRRQRRQLRRNLRELDTLMMHQAALVDPSELYHAVVFALYNEPFEIIEPGVKALLGADIPPDRMILVIAYEERGGELARQTAEKLIEQHGSKFAHAMAVCHPDGIAGEVIGKGANISFAARKLAARVEQLKIDPANVIVTTLDADNVPARNYFGNLTYCYASDPNRLHRSFQPIPMFVNNIWYAAAPMRVMAAGNSFWIFTDAMQPRRLRNFSAHAQSLGALIQTDFWSTTTIVEDGHQYWRSYFSFEGDYQVVPVFAPVYQDAVIASTYWRTIKVQYRQLRRWAWGVSDFSYVIRGLIKEKRISKTEKMIQAGRFVESHFSRATAPLVITFVAWLPLYLNHQFSHMYLAHQLPVVTSYILRIALIGLLITIYFTLATLPPRPPRYRRYRKVMMVLQWVLMPLTAICFSALAALDSQTRLALGRGLDFQVTEKVKKQ